MTRPVTILAARRLPSEKDDPRGEERLEDLPKNGLALVRPPYCECARIAKRPLAWGLWLSELSDSEDGSFLDRNNLELSHEHLFFEQSGHNIGFGPKGLFSEEKTAFSYREGKECYNGELMRQVLERIPLPHFYSLIGNNCQRFIEKVREAYHRYSAFSTQ